MCLWIKVPFIDRASSTPFLSATPPSLLTSEENPFENDDYEETTDDPNTNPSKTLEGDPISDEPDQQEVDYLDTQTDYSANEDEHVDTEPSEDDESEPTLEPTLALETPRQTKIPEVASTKRACLPISSFQTFQIASK